MRAVNSAWSSGSDNQLRKWSDRGFSGGEASRSFGPPIVGRLSGQKPAFFGLKEVFLGPKTAKIREFCLPIGK
jgi:hypothetical protein